MLGLVLSWLAAATGVPDNNGNDHALLEPRGARADEDQACVAVRESRELRLPHVTSLQPGLSSALNRLQAARLTFEQKTAYKRDGFVVVRSLVHDATLLHGLSQHLWQHTGSFIGDGSAATKQAVLFNAAVRQLVASNLSIGALAASAEGWDPTSPIALTESGVWGYCAADEDAPDSWHVDFSPFTEGVTVGRDPVERREKAGIDSRVMDPPSLTTVYLAMNDAVRPLELIAGSHRYRREIYAACAQSPPHFLDAHCIDHFLSMRRGTLTPVRPDLRAGDAILFTGTTVHRGWVQTVLLCCVTHMSHKIPFLPPSI